MKKLYKILSLILAVIMLSSLVACGGESGEVEVRKQIDAEETTITDRVNYSNSTKQFEYWAYHAVDDGKFNYRDGKEYDIGETLYTKERIKEYFESGMTLLAPQATAPANRETMLEAGKTFNQTLLGQIMDDCVALGYKNSVVLSDNWIMNQPWLAAKDKYASLADADWKQATLFTSDLYVSEAVLDAHVETNMREYYFHEAFRGMYLPDEPPSRYLNIIGELYKSVRRVEAKLKVEKAAKLGVSVDSIPDLYIHNNLFPYYDNVATSAYMTPTCDTSFSKYPEERNHENYRRYIERYFEVTGADYVAADIYPMKSEEIYKNYVINLQIMAEVAKKYDAKIIVVTQTNTDQGQRVVDRSELNYLNNIVMGFGSANVVYYSYYNLDDSNEKSSASAKYYYDDNGAMMNRFGDKTPLYYTVQELNGVGQKLAPTILNFNYKTSKTYISSTVKSAATHMEVADMYEGIKFANFTKLTKFEIDKEMAVVTELYDGASGRENYMYMAMNTVDPAYKGSAYYQKATMTFASEFNSALIFLNGESKAYKLDANGSISVKLRPGEACYVIPFAG